MVLFLFHVSLSISGSKAGTLEFDFNPDKEIYFRKEGYIYAALNFLGFIHLSLLANAIMLAQGRKLHKQLLHRFSRENVERIYVSSLQPGL